MRLGGHAVYDVADLKGEDGQVYFPVKQVCEGLGVDPDHQMRRLNETPEYRTALVDIRLTTTGGMQKVACIRRYEAPGGW